jgi:hypothetical protein
MAPMLRRPRHRSVAATPPAPGAAADNPAATLA